VAGITMDAGALIAVDRNDRRVLVLLARASETRSRITVPASALAQAVRHPERQARLARLLRQPTTDVVPLDRVDGTNVGRLLAASGTSEVVDAHVVICARRAGQRAVTSDPDDLRALDPTLQVVTI
jgi:predicted nucleic acid-binding protein